MCVDQVNKAMQAMLKLERKFSMHTSEGQTQVIIIQNKWLPLPEKVATSGVLISAINASTSPSISCLVFIPINGRIKPHFHKSKTQTISVVSGVVSYVLYETDENSEVVDKGQLKMGDSIFIAALTSQYIFTTQTQAYIRVDFDKKTQING